jgi:hypothetical protein
MKKIFIIILKVLLITFIGNVLMKQVIPSLGINPIISALMTPILVGVLIYFLFFKKTNLKTIENSGSEKTSKKRNIIIPIIGLIAFGFLFFIIQYFSSEKPTFDKVMIEYANEINKTCPSKVDEDIRLDNTMAMPNNKFKYNYTLINLEKQNIDSNEIKDLLEPTLINNIKSSPDFKIFRDNKTTLTFNFKDKNGQYVLEINVTPKNYD